MKINSTGMNFGASLVAKANIQDINKNKVSSSLYEYNSNNLYDVRKIRESLCRGDIDETFYDSFLNEPYSRFFVLRDDRRDKAIAAFQITSHISTNNPVVGNYIEINQMNKDEQYLNSLTPIIRYIKNTANINNMDNIVASGDNLPSSDMKKYGFKEVKYGSWIMPKENFHKNNANKKTDSISYYA